MNFMGSPNREQNGTCKIQKPYVVSFTNICRINWRHHSILGFKTDDPKKAKKCLYLGIVLAIVGIIINILIVTQIPDLAPDFNVNV